MSYKIPEFRLKYNGMTLKASKIQLIRIRFDRRFYPDGCF